MKNIIIKIFSLLKFKRLLLQTNNICKTVVIGKNTIIEGSSLYGKITIGNNCKIHFVDMNGEISIGNNTSLWGPNIDLTCSLNKIEIGNFCSIAKNVTFQEFNHNINRFTTYYVDKNILGNKHVKTDLVSKGSISIEHDVWIGAHSVILSGVNIGIGAIVAANSVVTTNIPAYAIVGGSPAKIIKYRFSENVIEKLLASKWWLLNKEELKDKIELFDKLIEE